MMEFDLEEGQSKLKKDYVYFNIKCENSFFVFHYNNPLRKACFYLSHTKQKTFDGIILLIIIFGSIKLAFDTYIDPNSSASFNVIA